MSNQIVNEVDCNSDIPAILLKDREEEHVQVMIKYYSTNYIYVSIV